MRGPAAPGMRRFTDTLRRHGPPADRWGSDKLTAHAYGELYDELWGRYADVPGLRVLVLGVYRGAFVRALDEFLPPDAAVRGVDVTLSWLADPLYSPRVRLVEADATRPEAVASVRDGGPFDVIIDDASHLPGDQLAALDLWAPLLKPGGTYVIEDIQPATADRVRRGAEHLAAAHGLALHWLDLRAAKGRFDDIVAVLERVTQRTT